MGTANFARGNASRYFVCLTNDEEGDGPDQWEIDDFKDNVRDAAKGLPGYQKETGGDGARNYPSWELFSVRDSKELAGVWLEVIVTAKLTAGYYEGATLDWDAQIYVGGCDSDIDDAEENFMDQCEFPGLKKVHAKRVASILEKMKDDLVADVEKVFSEWSESYGCAGRFSNGEAIYTKVDPQE